MAKYSKEFKEEALKISDEIGVKRADLEKQNAELRQANEILKDALVFFAKDRKK